MEGREVHELKDVLAKFREVTLRRFLTKEDRIDTAGAVPGHTTYPIIDQLRGESKKRWQRKFGDVAECNKFIAVHPQLRGISKEVARAVMDENDLWIQTNAIENLGMELIVGKNTTSPSYLYG